MPTCRHLWLALATNCIWLLAPLEAHAAAKNREYFAWREQVRSANWTDLQKRRFCNSLLYTDVFFRSKVSRVDEDGTVYADMDDAMLSVDDIRLTGLSISQAEGLNRGQWITYRGTITSCKATEFTLLLGVSH